MTQIRVLQQRVSIILYLCLVMFSDTQRDLLMSTNGKVTTTKQNKPKGVQDSNVPWLNKKCKILYQDSGN